MFTADERIRETSTTTGTGTYTLVGAPTGYQPVSSIGANNFGQFFITDGTNWESIIGQYLSGPDRLTRDAVLASSNADAAVSWTAGTRTIRGGPIAGLSLPRVTSKSIAGGAATTVLTQNEQRCQILVLTGVLTGNQIVECDATPWGPQVVYNNTSGAFSVTYRVTGQTGVSLLQGARTLVHCDGTDVRPALPYAEGTWTPGLAFGGGTTGLTYTTQTGTYTKMGRLVIAHFQIVVNNKGSSAGTAKITGLPFTSGNPMVTSSHIQWFNMTTAFVAVIAQVNAADTKADLRGNTGATAVGPGTISDTDFANGCSLLGTLIYHT